MTKDRHPTTPAITAIATTLLGVQLLTSSPSPAQPQALASEHKVTLRAIMQELGAEYLRLANALLTDDVQALEQSAKAIQTHPLPNDIVDAIKQRLGRQFTSFERLDEQSHRGAAGVARAASAGNLAGAAKAFGELTGGCVGCHKLFRAKLKSLSD